MQLIQALPIYVQKNIYTCTVYYLFSGCRSYPGAVNSLEIMVFVSRYVFEKKKSSLHIISLPNSAHFVLTLAAVTTLMIYSAGVHFLNDYSLSSGEYLYTNIYLGCFLSGESSSAGVKIQL